MTGIKRRSTIIGLAASAGAMPRAVRAQATDWPNRPVRVIVPYAPGAGTDVIVRAVAERLSRQTGQQFVVEHKGGAAGALGAETVAKSPKDGYTIVMTPQAPIQLIPNLRKLPYSYCVTRSPFFSTYGGCRNMDIAAGRVRASVRSGPAT